MPARTYTYISPIRSYLLAKREQARSAWNTVRSTLARYVPNSFDMQPANRQTLVSRVDELTVQMQTSFHRKVSDARNKIIKVRADGWCVVRTFVDRFMLTLYLANPGSSWPGLLCTYTYIS
jgi:hypothetical protein